MSIYILRSKKKLLCVAAFGACIGEDRSLPLPLLPQGLVIDQGTHEMCNLEPEIQKQCLEFTSPLRGKETRKEMILPAGLLRAEEDALLAQGIELVVSVLAALVNKSDWSNL